MYGVGFATWFLLNAACTGCQVWRLRGGKPSNQLLPLLLTGLFLLLLSWAGFIAACLLWKG